MLRVGVAPPMLSRRNPPASCASAQCQRCARVQVLSNHIVLGARDAATLLADIQEAGVGGLVLPTLGGSNLVLSSDGLTITILPEGAPPILAPAVVEEADLLACGGVMHIIDSVLEEGPGAVDGAATAATHSPRAIFAPFRCVAAYSSVLRKTALLSARFHFSWRGMHISVWSRRPEHGWVCGPNLTERKLVAVSDFWLLYHEHSL